MNFFTPASDRQLSLRLSLIKLEEEQNYNNSILLHASVRVSIKIPFQGEFEASPGMGTILPYTQ